MIKHNWGTKLPQVTNNVYTIAHTHTYIYIYIYHDLNHSKKSLIYDFFLLPIFLIADLYEFNTNNCLQASRSAKVCMFF